MRARKRTGACDGCAPAFGVMIAAASPEGRPSSGGRTVEVFLAVNSARAASAASARRLSVAGWMTSEPVKNSLSW
jgi:hypothetical protein